MKLKSLILKINRPCNVLEAVNYIKIGNLIIETISHSEIRAVLKTTRPLGESMLEEIIPNQNGVLLNNHSLRMMMMTSFLVKIP
jgi:hypothetical protein